MVLPNLVFDALLFGALALAALLDLFVPSAGVLGMLAVGGALYLAAQEWCDALQRRKLWTQESLATSVATTVAGFVFFWGRNGSDFVLLILSIGLMMAALMAAISIIAMLGAMWRQKSLGPLLGLLLSLGGALTLGLAGGVLTLDSRLLLGVAVAGLIVWKLREVFVRPATRPAATPEPAAPPLETPLATSLEAAPHEQFAPANAAFLPDAVLPDARPRPTARPVAVAPIAPPVHRVLMPQRGTLLDRLLPVLLLGVLGFLAWRGANHSPLGIQTPAAAVDAPANAPAK